jgi:hypothetical protein
MGVIDKGHGEYPAICNDCGVVLCIGLSLEEYMRAKGYWDNWTCVYCNPYALGSLAAWLQTHEIGS